MEQSKRLKVALMYVVAALLAGGLLWCGAAYFLGALPLQPVDILAGHTAAEADLFGLVLVDVDTEDAVTRYQLEEKGVYVWALAEGSSAADAGIQCGDRIIGLEEKAISLSGDIISYLESHEWKTEYRVKVARQDEIRTLIIRSGSR